MKRQITKESLELTVDGKILKMDSDVYEFLKDKNIQFNSGGYPYISLHRMFFEKKDKLVIDHINRDTLDFRRDNLRQVSFSINSQNRSGKKSIYKKSNGIHRSRVCKDGKTIEINSTKESCILFNDLCTFVFYGRNAKFINKESIHPLLTECEAKMIVVDLVTQSRKRHSKVNYFGVYKNNTGWFAKTKINKKRKEKHGFKTEFDAATWRDSYLRDNGAEKNIYFNFLNFEELLYNEKKNN